VSGKLHCSIRTQGTTKTVSFRLPKNLKEYVSEPIGVNTSINIGVPQVEFVLRDQDETEIVHGSVQNIKFQLVGHGGRFYIAYFTIGDGEVDNMSPTAEYPVLFATDKRKLQGFKANFVEALCEFTFRDNKTSVDYVGLRLLPFVLKIDGEILTQFKTIYGLLQPVKSKGAIPFSLSF